MQQVLIFPQIRRLKICLVSIIALAKLHAHASPMRPSLGIWQYLFFDSLIQHLVQGSAFLNQLMHLASFVHVDHTSISEITFMITLWDPVFLTSSFPQLKMLQLMIYLWQHLLVLEGMQVRS